MTAENIQIELFGQPQVLYNGKPLQLARRKSRAVLYYIAAQERRVSRSQLLALFWPDLPRPAGQQTLRTTLHGLRQALGDGVVIDGEHILLAEWVQVDVHRFASGLAPSARDVEGMQAVLDLYQGDFLEGFSLETNQGAPQAFDDWVIVERERYRRLAIRGLSALAAGYEAQQEYAAAQACLERALVFNPLQEDLQRECMRLLYLAGDRPGAIQRYTDLRKLLDEEMGVPPMAETRALYDAIITDRLPAPQKLTRLRQAGPAQLPTPRLPVVAPDVLARDELPFVGRSQELKLLRDSACAGKFVLIEGEGGIGKTRLAQEFIRASATLALVGQGRELEMTLPYQPWIEALRGWLQQGELQNAPGKPTLLAVLQASLAPVWLDEVSRLLPELSGSRPAAGNLERAAEEARLWEGVRQLLLLLAARQPLVIFLDDLQWVDASSLGLLGYLVRQNPGPAVSFLGAARQFYPNSPAAKNSALVAFVQASLRENRLARLLLARLSPEVAKDAAIQEIVRRISPQTTGDLAEWLVKTSEGNPYILTELLREAVRRQIQSLQGMLDPAAALADFMTSPTPLVPQTVYSLIQARLGKLSEAARRVLDAAVAAGREFEFEVVALAAGLSEAAALDALDELKAAGLVLPGRGTRLVFDHSLTMEVAYREVGETRHRLLHRRIAEALESLYRDRLDEIAGQLAWHFTESNAWRQAAPYAFQSGQRAMRLAAWNEAVGFFEMALKGSPDQRASAPGRMPDLDRSRLEILSALGDAYDRAGHYAKSSEVLRQAVELAGQAEAAARDPRVSDLLDQVQLALARALLPQARFAEAIEVAGQMGASGRAEGRLKAELIWGTVLSIEGRDLQAAQEHLQAAEAMWQECKKQDVSLLTQVKFELGSVSAQLGELEQAVAYYRAALAVSSAAGADAALEHRILALNNLAYHLHLLNDPQAGPIAHQGLALAQEKGALGLQAFLYSTLGEIALAGGDIGQAEKYFLDGLELAQRFSMRERVAGLTANLGRVAAQRGQADLAIQHLSKALEMADGLGIHHLGVQIRLWLAALLPGSQARQRLAEARLTAEASGRRRLLDEIIRVEQQIEERTNER